MSTDTSTKPRFGRGGEAAEKITEESSRSFGSIRRTNYLPNLAKGDSVYLRYLTDSPQWFYVQSHTSAPTKPKPADMAADRKWPESMPSVCRYDKAFQADPETGDPAIYNDCYICDANLVNQWGRSCKPSIRVYALAVLREPVTGTQEMVAAGQIDPSMIGRRLGFRDKMRDVEVPERDANGDVRRDAEGKAILRTESEIAIVVVCQSTRNYFGGLQSLYNAYGTVCDRDYLVTRKGEGKDTDYPHVPMDPNPSLKPGTEKWERYSTAIKEQGDSVNIETILMDRSSDEYYARFFDPSKTAAPSGTARTSNDAAGGKSQTPPVVQQAAAPTNEASSDMLAQMRARMRGETPPPAPQAPAEQAPQAAPAAAPAAAAAVDYD